MNGGTGHGVPQVQQFPGTAEELNKKMIAHLETAVGEIVGASCMIPSRDNILMTNLNKLKKISEEQEQMLTMLRGCAVEESLVEAAIKKSKRSFRPSKWYVSYIQGNSATREMKYLGLDGIDMSLIDSAANVEGEPETTPNQEPIEFEAMDFSLCAPSTARLGESLQVIKDALDEANKYIKNSQKVARLEIQGLFVKAKEQGHELKAYKMCQEHSSQVREIFENWENNSGKPDQQSLTEQAVEPISDLELSDTQSDDQTLQLQVESLEDEVKVSSAPNPIQESFSKASACAEMTESQMLSANDQPGTQLSESINVTSNTVNANETMSPLSSTAQSSDDAQGLSVDCMQEIPEMENTMATAHISEQSTNGNGEMFREPALVLFPHEPTMWNTCIELCFIFFLWVEQVVLRASTTCRCVCENIKNASGAEIIAWICRMATALPPALGGLLKRTMKQMAIWLIILVIRLMLVTGPILSVYLEWTFICVVKGLFTIGTWVYRIIMYISRNERIAQVKSMVTAQLSAYYSTLKRKVQEIFKPLKDFAVDAERVTGHAVSMISFLIKFTLLMYLLRHAPWIDRKLSKLYRDRRFRWYLQHRRVVNSVVVLLYLRLVFVVMRHCFSKA